MFSLILAETGVLPEVDGSCCEFTSLEKARDCAWEFALELGESIAICRGLPLSQNIVEVLNS
jgi:hypothetical protein